MQTLSIVIPIYNEKSTLPEIIHRVLAVPLPMIQRELLLIDDGSDDGTRALLEDLPGLVGEVGPEIEFKVLFQDFNQGKGAALRRGFAEACGDIIMVQDADLEYDPAEYPKLLAPLLDGRADVVYGSRFAGGDAHRVLSFWHLLGNRFLTLCSNALTNLNLTDMECCYKLFRREILEQVQLKENRFGIEPEITAKIARLNCRIYEVGVNYFGRTYAEGKKIGWKDGVRALWCILKYNLLAERKK